MYSISLVRLPAVGGMHAKWAPRGGHSTSNRGKSTSTAERQVFRRADLLKMDT